VAEFLKPQSVGVFESQAASILLEDVVATILDITVKAWPAVAAGGKVGPQSHEDEISDELRWEMDAEKKRRRPVPHLRFERETQSDLPDKSRDVGLIDVFVIYSFEQREYFAIECKRLKDADSALARLYVTEGVHRFVSGKYSLGHPYASMVGFVCSGRSADVAALVEKTLTTFDREVSGMSTESSWQPERRFGAHPLLYSTRHAQIGVSNEITLLHLYFDFPPNSSPDASLS
jgi:hypothetical protein